MCGKEEDRRKTGKMFYAFANGFAGTPWSNNAQNYVENAPEHIHHRGRYYTYWQREHARKGVLILSSLSQDGLPQRAFSSRISLRWLLSCSRMAAIPVVEISIMPSTSTGKPGGARDIVVQNRFNMCRDCKIESKIRISQSI
jgi:hypothetical protein